MKNEIKTHALTLDLESETFSDFKADFNALLKAIIYEMFKNQSRHGEMTASMQIDITETEVVDELGCCAILRMPLFNHKITTKMTFKNEKKGCLSGKYDLRFDEAEHEYYLVKADDGQTSLLDM